VGAGALVDDLSLGKRALVTGEVAERPEASAARTVAAVGRTQGASASRQGSGTPQALACCGVPVMMSE